VCQKHLNRIQFWSSCSLADHTCLYFFWLGHPLPRCLVRFFLHVQQEPYRSEGEDKACEATDNTPSHRTFGVAASRGHRGNAGQYLGRLQFGRGLAISLVDNVT